MRLIFEKLGRRSGVICRRDALCAARRHHHILHLDVLRRGVEQMLMSRACAAADSCWRSSLRAKGRSEKVVVARS